jgi:TPR repeat protein
MQENIINTDLDKARSLYEKAIRLSTINTSKQNIKKAVDCFQEAAKLGHIHSSYIVGEAYCKGKYARNVDDNECLNYLLNAAKKNHTEAMVVFGDLHHKEGQIFDAMNEYMLALSYGSATALNRINGLINNPIGKNYLTNLFKREEEDRSDSNLPFYIATCYLHGFGTDKDLKRAHGWLKESSRQDNAFALHGLGQMYEHGIEVEPDLATAADLYLKAGENGFSKGYVALATLEAQKVAELNKTKPDYSKVIEYLNKAMEMGDYFASNELGTIHAQGLALGFPDYGEALACFQHSADYGNPDAAINLANLYFSATGNKSENLMKAEAYFSSLITLDDQYSMIAYYGIGRIKQMSVDKRARKLAKKYIQKSADMGFVSAKEYLKELKSS